MSAQLPPNGGNGIPYWGRNVIERLDRLERLEPAVVANEVKNLREEVQSLRRAIITFGLGVVGSAVIFALTVFSLLGQT